MACSTEPSKITISREFPLVSGQTAWKSPELDISCEGRIHGGRPLLSRDCRTFSKIRSEKAGDPKIREKSAKNPCPLLKKSAKNPQKIRVPYSKNPRKIRKKSVSLLKKSVQKSVQKSAQKSVQKSVRNHLARRPPPEFFQKSTKIRSKIRSKIREKSVQKSVPRKAHRSKNP